MPDETAEVFHQKIDKAVLDHFGLWLTDESRAAIQRDAGSEGLASIQEISDFANRSDFWIYSTSTTSGYEEVTMHLRKEYPFLSDGAIVRIASAAAYSWK